MPSHRESHDKSKMFQEKSVEELVSEEANAQSSIFTDFHPAISRDQWRLFS
jgi:hypothetical protein